MASSDFRLVYPSSHDLYFTLEGVGYSQPLVGSAILTLSPFLHISEIKNLRVCLVRSVASTSGDSTDSSNKFASWLYRQNFKSASPSNSQYLRSCAIIEDLIIPISLHYDHHVQVGDHPDRGKIFNIPLAIPISVNIPGTTTTPTGSISYCLVAYAATAGGQVISTSKIIALRRHIIPGHEQIEHTRTYTKSKIISEMSLEQHSSSE